MKRQRNKRVACAARPWEKGGAAVAARAAFNQRLAPAIHETMSTSRFEGRVAREPGEKKERKKPRFTRVPSILHK